VRARDLGEDEVEKAVLERAGWLVEMVRAASEEGHRPVEQARLATAEAELARARGEDDPILWAAAAAAWTELAHPYPAAIAIWRQAQAELSRGDREAATAALSASSAIATGLGAAWLQAEIDGFAARARLSVAADPATDEPGPEPEEVPFGLTPRELQVLELVASGATNREIGERLFMAEKTASVHVSRILTKLDVRGRTEAAAVAHRHGIGAQADRT
jgi:DNA-binding NarL/FixJ family response regulator